MLQENEELREKIIELQRNRYHNTQNAALTQGKPLTRKEATAKMVQESLLMDRTAQILRMEQKDLKLHRDRMQELVNKYRRGMKYRDAIQQANEDIAKLADEHRDLSLEVRCNEKLLVMHEKVVESGEGPHRLQEELRAQRALTQRGLDHAIRDAEVAERQRNGVRQRVEALRDEVSARQGTASSNDLQALQQLRDENRNKALKLQQLKRRAKQAGAGKGSSTSAGGSGGSEHRGHPSDAERDYLQERIAFMQTELERIQSAQQEKQASEHESSQSVRPATADGTSEKKDKKAAQEADISAQGGGRAQSADGSTANEAGTRAGRLPSVHTTSTAGAGDAAVTADEEGSEFHRAGGGDSSVREQPSATQPNTSRPPWEEDDYDNGAQNVQGDNNAAGNAPPPATTTDVGHADLHHASPSDWLTDDTPVTGAGGTSQGAGDEYGTAASGRSDSAAAAADSPGGSSHNVPSQQQPSQRQTPAQQSTHSAPSWLDDDDENTNAHAGDGDGEKGEGAAENGGGGVHGSSVGASSSFAAAAPNGPGGQQSQGETGIGAAYTKNTSLWDSEPQGTGHAGPTSTSSAHGGSSGDPYREVGDESQPAIAAQNDSPRELSSRHSKEAGEKEEEEGEVAAGGHAEQEEELYEEDGGFVEEELLDEVEDAVEDEDVYPNEENHDNEKEDGDAAPAATAGGAAAGDDDDGPDWLKF